MVLTDDRSIPTQRHAVTICRTHIINNDDDNDDNNYDRADNCDYLLGLCIRCLMVRGVFGK